jgi:ATP synthase protein I
LAQSPDDKQSDADLRARLDSLSSSLDAQETREPKAPVQDTSLAGAMSIGFQVLSEFVAGIVVGALIGWQLDKWFHTSPILLIVFLTLGTAAGFWNVYRIAAKPTGRGTRGPL